ncbi:MAG: LytTR family DNA-binding domain-containing protein [Bacteroidia bacterium]
MIRALIVEDEKRSAMLLEKLLKEFCLQVEVIGICHDVSAAIEKINSLKPDLVFLDIEMQSETGFDLLKKFNEINFAVIFTTAYEKYALRAIKFSAIDYLMKPIDVEELKCAVSKAEKQHQKNSVQNNFDVLLHNLQNKNSDSQKIALSTAEGLHLINVTDIYYCESDGPYTTFHLKHAKPIIISKHLKEYEELLTPFNFFRIHNSYLINMRELKKYIRGDGGQVEMNEGTLLNVSKSRKDDLVRIISGNR